MPAGITRHPRFVEISGATILFAGASFLTDEQRHIVRVMAMDPGRKWLGDEIFADMEDDGAACLAWDDLSRRGCIREGRLHLDALRSASMKHRLSQSAVLNASCGW